jgi:hypothetical protein
MSGKCRRQFRDSKRTMSSWSLTVVQATVMGHEGGTFQKPLQSLLGAESQLPATRKQAAHAHAERSEM